MKAQLYKQLAGIDTSHWYFVSRLRLMEVFLKRLSFIKGLEGLDIGCGPGGNTEALNEFCDNITGVDLSSDAISIAKERFPDASFIEGDVNNMNEFLQPSSYDLITDFNMLYHDWVEDEEVVVQQIYDLLKPGGVVVLTEPAFRILYRHHDVLDMGKTRYLLKDFSSMLNRVGFESVDGSYFNSISFFPALLFAFRDRCKCRPVPVGDAEVLGELKMPWFILNKALILVLSLEAKLIKLCGSIPLGVTLMCVARKPFDE